LLDAHPFAKSLSKEKPLQNAEASLYLNAHEGLGECGLLLWFDELTTIGTLN
jgi:hypothetical protein